MAGFERGVDGAQDPLEPLLGRRIIGPVGDRDHDAQPDAGQLGDLELEVASRRRAGPLLIGEPGREAPGQPALVAAPARAGGQHPDRADAGDGGDQRTEADHGAADQARDHAEPGRAGQPADQGADPGGERGPRPAEQVGGGRGRPGGPGHRRDLARIDQAALGA